MNEAYLGQDTQETKTDLSLGLDPSWPISWLCFSHGFTCFFILLLRRAESSERWAKARHLYFCLRHAVFNFPARQTSFKVNLEEF